MIDKMVGENKGKEGKSLKLDLGYKRNSTHECGNENKNGRKNSIEIKENRWMKFE